MVHGLVVLVLSGATWTVPTNASGAGPGEKWGLYAWGVERGRGWYEGFERQQKKGPDVIYQ